MKRMDAIKTFFNTPGYPPVEGSDLLVLRRADKTAGTNHYEELAQLCAAALGVELDQTV